MEYKLNGYTQIDGKEFIFAIKENRTKKCLAGKVVEDCGFVSDESEEKNIFVITFTDKTFIAIGIDEDEWKLAVKFIMKPDAFGKNYVAQKSFMDYKGDVCYPEWISLLRKMGIWTIDDEEVKAGLEQLMVDRKRREYREYLRLKEKFENMDVSQFE